MPSISHFLTLIFLLLLTAMSIQGKLLAEGAVKRIPASAVEYRTMDIGDPFQLCSDCRCCSEGDPTDCSQVSCCYHIDCDLPDKPYGSCAFVPQSCDCTDCA